MSNDHSRIQEQQDQGLGCSEVGLKIATALIVATLFRTTSTVTVMTPVLTWAKDGCGYDECHGDVEAVAVAGDAAPE